MTTASPAAADVTVTSTEVNADPDIAKAVSRMVDARMQSFVERKAAETALLSRSLRDAAERRQAELLRVIRAEIRRMCPCASGGPCSTAYGGDGVSGAGQRCGEEGLASGGQILGRNPSQIIDDLAGEGDDARAVGVHRDDGHDQCAVGQ